MRATFKVKDVSLKVLKDLKELEKRTNSGIKNAFFDIGKQLRDTARAEILRTPKNGIIHYWELNGRVVAHRSSAPGEAPANFTGRLRKSVDYKVRGAQQLEFFATAPYARDLEKGNRDINLLPRPYMLASIDSNQDNIQSYLIINIKKALKS